MTISSSSAGGVKNFSRQFPSGCYSACSYAFSSGSTALGGSRASECFSAVCSKNQGAGAVRDRSALGAYLSFLGVCSGRADFGTENRTENRAENAWRGDRGQILW